MGDYKFKVSVIMPVYNSEEYLEKTLQSVCNQTLSDIEVICVDDGSTDNSKNIIKSFAEKDRRICLVEQKNLFAGVARNNGFEHSSGEYVVFWDSDDFFNAKALEIMYKKAVKDEADICLCDAYNYSSANDKNSVSDEFVKYDILPAETPFNRNDIPDKIFNIGANVPWNKMFRAGFIREKGLKFQNIQQSNDTYFVLMAIFLAERITYTKKRLIHYRRNAKGGLTDNVNKTPLCSYEAYSYLKEELEKLTFYSEENRKSFVNRAVRGMLRALHTQNTQEGFDSVRDALVHGGLEKLGLICDAETYEAKWLYTDVQSLLTKTGTEHMIYKFNSAKKSKEKFKSKVIVLEEHLDKNEKRLEEQLKTNDVLNEKILQKNERIKVLKERVSENKKELKENKKLINNLEKKLKEKNQQLEQLQSKWYVRLFSKIERVFNRFFSSK